MDSTHADIARARELRSQFDAEKRNARIMRQRAARLRRELEGPRRPSDSSLRTWLEQSAANERRVEARAAEHRAAVEEVRAENLREQLDDTAAREKVRAACNRLIRAGRRIDPQALRLEGAGGKEKWLLEVAGDLAARGQISIDGYNAARARVLAEPTLPPAEAARRLVAEYRVAWNRITRKGPRNARAQQV